MYTRYLVLVVAFALTGCAGQKVQSMNDTKQSHYENLKEMFHEMVVKKNAEVIPKYYHPEFLLLSNGKKMNYAENLKFHQEVYATPIQYKIEFDKNTIVEDGDKIASRVFITTQRPGERPREIEVLLIAQYKDNKIFRVWELTFPDWSKMPAFENGKSK